MIYNGFVGPAYVDASLPISAQRCVNWYLRVPQNEDAGARKALMPMPGYKLLETIEDETLPDGSFIRGTYKTSRGIGLIPDVGGSVLVVAGTGVFWLKPDYTYEKLGSISNQMSRVSIVDDGFGAIIADGANIYRLDLETKSFSNVGFNLTDPTGVAFHNGYTLAIGTSAGLPQNTFFWSGLYKNNLWDAESYSSAENSADPITAIITTEQYVCLFGPNSYELWNSTGDAGEPFARAYASAGSIGIHAPQSAIRFGNNVYILGADGKGGVAAYVLEGSTLRMISDVPLNREWGGNLTSDCTTWSATIDGTSLIFFNFDALNKTYAYNITTNTWTECASRDGISDTLFRWEPNFAVSMGNDLIVGDRFSTNLYLLSSQYLTENGNTVLRIRSCPHQNAEQKPVKYKAIRIDMDTGAGINTEDPDRYTEAGQIMFRYSHDRARTWSSDQRREYGRLGVYDASIEFPNLGISRNLTPELSISDPAGTAILGAFIYVEVAQRTRR